MDTPPPSLKKKVSVNLSNLSYLSTIKFPWLRVSLILIVQVGIVHLVHTQSLPKN